jgi:hypothetical protein
MKVEGARTFLPLLTFILLAGIASAGTLEIRSADAQESTAPPLTVATDNDSVNVVIDWDMEEIQPNQQVAFALDFQNPSSGQSISHVNYNFRVIDESGSTVTSAEEQHTHGGTDSQAVTFANMGSFKLEVTILGTGINPPFDTAQSGTAEAAITVVPEFPVVPAVLAGATGLLLGLRRLKMFQKIVH